MYQSDYGGAFGYLTNCLFVASAGCGGFVTCKGDNFSEMWSAYEAPETGYRTRITFAHARTPDRISKNETLLKDSYLIFRSRVNTDQSGKVLAAHYGKLFRFEYGEDYKKQGFGFVRFTYYFNPRPNDRYLEAEGRYPRDEQCKRDTLMRHKNMAMRNKCRSNIVASLAIGEK